MTNTDNLTMALGIVLAINLMLFLGQHALNNINPSSGINLMNPEGSTLCQFDANECKDGNYTIASTDPTTYLPSSSTSVSTSTQGNEFTDAFTSIKDWFIQKTGIGYILGLVSAPANFLQAIGLPDAFSWAIGALWYGLTLFLLIAFLWGR